MFEYRGSREGSLDAAKGKLGDAKTFVSRCLVGNALVNITNILQVES